jgi:hypothetical protein
VDVGVRYRLAPRDEAFRRTLTVGPRLDEDQEGGAAPPLGPVEPDVTAAYATAPRAHRRDEPGQTAGSPHAIGLQKIEVEARIVQLRCASPECEA